MTESDGATVSADRFLPEERFLRIPALRLMCWPPRFQSVTGVICLNTLPHLETRMCNLIGNARKNTPEQYYVRYVFERNSKILLRELACAGSSTDHCHYLNEAGRGEGSPETSRKEFVGSSVPFSGMQEHDSQDSFSANGRFSE